MKKISLLVFTTMLCMYCNAQISYQSKIRKSNDYVPPVDLNLMREVVQQKQNNYNSNASNISSRLSTISKIIPYVGDLNRNLFINEYNQVANVARNSDLSDANIYRSLSFKIDLLSSVLDFTLKNPSLPLPDDYFNIPVPTNY